MEISLFIDFDCNPAHVVHWESAFKLMAMGKLGWQLQEALDPISQAAADSLDDVWDALPYGNGSFEVISATVEGTHCHLRLLTGSPVIESLESSFLPWLQLCEVLNIRQCRSNDEE